MRGWGGVLGDSIVANAILAHLLHCGHALTIRGTRPIAPRDQRTMSAYIFGAVCPNEGKGARLCRPAATSVASPSGSRPSWHILRQVIQRVVMHLR